MVSMTGLYVHVPFCDTKCGYCDFYSIPLGDRQTTPLVRALVDELDHRAAGIERFETIFVGGGTPTVLPLDDLRTLFQRLAHCAQGAPEFTVEANPATVDDEKIAILVGSGVRRMSFGGQSLNRHDLHVLERLHDPDDIAPSLRVARDGGVEEINLDLIFGIPGQTLASWKDTLRRAVDFETDHLSCYGLMYEPETPLTARLESGAIHRCDNELEADMYLWTVDYLSTNGFEQYEISNFARPGMACRHNLVYWHNHAYLGIGPSAASYLSGERCRNVAHIDTYVADINSQGEATRDHERLEGAARGGETAMLQLRMNRGIDVELFKTLVGLDPRTLYRNQISRFTGEGLLESSGEYIRLTPAGMLVADRVIREFIA